MKFDPNVVTVPVAELVPFLGGSEESVEFHIRRLKIEVLLDWGDRRALRVADARKVFQTWRVAAEAHSVRWYAYQAWRAAEKERKTRERAAAFAAERERIDRIRDERRQRTLAEDLAQREAALAAAEDAQGPSFDEWSGNILALTDKPS